MSYSGIHELEERNTIQIKSSKLFCIDNTIPYVYYMDLMVQAQAAINASGGVQCFVEVTINVIPKAKPLGA